MNCLAESLVEAFHQDNQFHLLGRQIRLASFPKTGAGLVDRMDDRPGEGKQRDFALERQDVEFPLGKCAGVDTDMSVTCALSSIRLLERSLAMRNISLRRCRAR